MSNVNVNPVLMDTANYVKTVGALVNDSTKYTIKLDELSVTNIVLIKYMQDLYDKLIEMYPSFTEEFKELFTIDVIQKKLNGYTNCLKKEINFYETKVASEDCILTELDGNIKMEKNDKQ